MAKGTQKLKASLMLCLLLCTAFSGCYGEEVESVQASEFSVESPESVLRGQYFSIEVTSDVDWTMNRSPGFYYMDEYDVLRDDVEMTFDASKTSLMFLVLDSGVSMPIILTRSFFCQIPKPRSMSTSTVSPSITRITFAL